MTRRSQHGRASLTGVCVCLFACDPAPELVGEGLAEPSGVDVSTVEWRLETGVDSFFLDIAPTPDGGVAVLERTSIGSTRLRRFTADGAEVLNVPAAGYPDHIDALGDDLLISGSVDVSPRWPDPDPLIQRAVVRRVSGDGEVLAEYVHPREGESNALGFGLGIGSDEIALIVDNRGMHTPGETRFELQRLTHTLDPVGDRVQFEGSVEGAGYGPTGELLALELDEGGAALVHTVGTDLPPLVVECQVLLASEGQSAACAATENGVRIRWLDSGDIMDAGSLGLAAAKQVVRADAFVAFGAVDDGFTSRVVSLADDGTVLGSADLPASDGLLGVYPHVAVRSADGALYVSILKYAEHGCDPQGSSCVSAELVRLLLP